MRAEAMPHQAADSGAHDSDQITDHESPSIATTVGIAEFRDETRPRKSDEKLPVDAGRIADKIEVKDQLEEQALIDSTLEGWRFQFVNLAMCLSLFLSQLEATIVSTSLVSLTSSLRAFSKSSWVVSVYLLTYTGFLIIIAKLSDIFGRKNFIVLVLGSFVAFSIGCGFSNDMTTLIVLRAFQGIGGGGMYAMAFIVLPEMVPISKYALYTAILASTIALAGLSGPLIGGAVNRNHDDIFAWRWIFLLNGPAGGVALALVLLAMPSNFPNHRKESPRKFGSVLTVENFKRIDVIGLLLLLGASILFVTALEEGGTRYSWHSVITLSLLIISLVLWVLLLTWEWYQSNHETKQEPVFPWRLATNRFAAGVFLNSFFTGAAMTTVIINLPQRFQVVNGNSPLEAGYRLLALTISISFGSFIGGVLVQKLCVPFMRVLMGFAPLQIAGLVLLGFSSSNKDIPSAIYGYQVVAGLGLGGSLGVSIMMIPFIATKQDMENISEDQRVIWLAAVGMSGAGQLRALGGSIGIAISTNVLNKHITSTLSSILSPIQLNELLQSAEVLAEFPPRLLKITRQAYSDAYNTQMFVLAAFSAATLMTTVLFWEKTPRRMTKS